MTLENRSADCQSANTMLGSASYSLISLTDLAFIIKQQFLH